MKKAFGFMLLGAAAAGIGMAIRDLVVSGVFEELSDGECDECCGCCCDESMGCDCEEDCENCPCTGCEECCEHCDSAGECDMVFAEQEEESTEEKLEQAAERSVK